MNEYNNILNNLEVLKLEKMRSYLPNYLEEITSKKYHFKKHFCRYELLIIDEIGYLPVDKQIA